MSGTEARIIVISGRVQGVSFRYYAQQEAVRLGLTGTVRNRREGTVEIFAQGEVAALETFVAWCRKGPPASRVIEVAVKERPASAGLTEFTVEETL